MNNRVWPVTTNQITHPPIQEVRDPKKEDWFVVVAHLRRRQVQYLLIQLAAWFYFSSILRSGSNQSQSADDHKKPTNVNQMWSSRIAQSQRLFFGVVVVDGLREFKIIRLVIRNKKPFLTANELLKLNKERKRIRTKRRRRRSWIYFLIRNHHSRLFSSCVSLFLTLLCLPRLSIYTTRARYSSHGITLHILGNYKCRAHLR